MDRELCSLPLDKLILTLLDKAGFLVVGDIVDFKAFELSKGWFKKYVLVNKVLFKQSD